MPNYLLRKMLTWYNRLLPRRKERFIASFSTPGEVLLGLGVSDGELTSKVAKKVKAERVIGIDLDEGNLLKARERGIETLVSDLNYPFPVSDNSVDIVSSDQVIEHLSNPDSFVKEIHRVLKKGGYAVLCTENLSSWHNLLALLLGQQAFSQDMSSACHLGNRFSLHYRESTPKYARHHKIFTRQGLVDLVRYHGFVVEEFFGVGYFPKVDPTHAYFIGVRIRKL